MSRVTVRELFNDIDDTCDDIGMEKYKRIKQVEIVPRKMVEMIIERCLIGEKLVNKTTAMEVRDIRNYAESLLKQFEEDKE